MESSLVPPVAATPPLLDVPLMAEILYKAPPHPQSCHLFRE